MQHSRQLVSFIFLMICLAACATAVSPANPAPTVPYTPQSTATATISPTQTALATATMMLETAVPATPAPTPCAAPGRVEMGSYPSATAGVMNYRIYLPPCYGLDGRRYPTIYLLGGNIHTDAIWDELGVDEIAEEGILAQEWPPMLIVMADGGWIANYSSGGPGSFESVIMNDLLPHVEQAYCAWDEPNGRSIGGLSRGGYWALEIAFRFPEQFASVGGHSAALLDQYAWPAINPQYTGLSQDLGDLRIYFDIGAQDYVINNIRQLHLDMETAVPPIPHTWVLNEGRHEEAYWQTHIPDYLTWYTEPWPFNRSDYPVCSP